MRRDTAVPHGADVAFTDLRTDNGLRKLNTQQKIPVGIRTPTGTARILAPAQYRDHGPQSRLKPLPDLNRGIAELVALDQPLPADYVAAPA